ncbi:hypothetical protein [Neorhizobium galegae]|uniref:hypothetical protein n=1 Tax=Neorhizobium galegae TaxID=399 RepID=UPI001F1F6BF3|nr:hypothetical protein [Neorhizobium galegae]UIK04823.1 hypothetical protein LZK81_19500 [Neorhizobium galegae]
MAGNGTRRKGGKPKGIPKLRQSLNIDKELLEEVRNEAKRDGMTFSDYFTSAIELKKRGPITFDTPFIGSRFKEDELTIGEFVTKLNNNDLTIVDRKQVEYMHKLIKFSYLYLYWIQAFKRTTPVIMADGVQEIYDQERLEVIEAVAIVFKTPEQDIADEVDQRIGTRLREDAASMAEAKSKYASEQGNKTSDEPSGGLLNGWLRHLFRR